MLDPLEDEASTPLTREEMEALIPSYITLRKELNAAEHANILNAEEWAYARKRPVLSEPFLKTLHKHMFDRVWRWAGAFRSSDRNIGVPPWQIGPELRTLLEDSHYWARYGTYRPDEMAARFHHRLGAIHPFPNGNGRHARLATDLWLAAQGLPSFTWGRIGLLDASDTRRAYVAALRAADTHDYQPLLGFVRS